MDHLWGGGRLVRAVAKSGVLRSEPFVLVDVGCSGGIHPAWRQFGDHLVAMGFDPNASECDRLQRAETNPNITYVPRFVSLPDDHPFIREGGRQIWSNNPWDRLSVAEATERARKRELSASSRRAANIWDDDTFADPGDPCVLPEYLRQQGLQRVDFIKVDVDGEDLVVLKSLEGELHRLQVLGLGVEVNFFGSSKPTDHTFHNVDRLLKAQGYELLDLSVRRYSTSDLPARFVHDVPGPTETGRVLQGDALYARDLASGVDDAPDSWTTPQVLKLACVFDLFGLQDCAAELLVRFRPRLLEAVDVDDLLNQLVPALKGRKLQYEHYMRRFAEDDPWFYPPFARTRRTIRARLEARLRAMALLRRIRAATRGKA